MDYNYFSRAEQIGPPLSVSVSSDRKARPPLGPLIRILGLILEGLFQIKTLSRRIRKKIEFRDSGDLFSNRPAMFAGIGLVSGTRTISVCCFNFVATELQGDM